MNCNSDFESNFFYTTTEWINVLFVDGCIQLYLEQNEYIVHDLSLFFRNIFFE